MIASNTVRLRADRDAGRLQRLLERCSDYYELHEAWATPPDAGEYELTLDPKTAMGTELFVFGLEQERDGELEAVLQMISDCPQPGTWWIGLLVVAPELRGRSLGLELARYAVATAADAGAATMKLAVSLRNPRGLRFWEKAGFRDTEVVCSVTARSGHVEQGRIMVRETRG